MKNETDRFRLKSPCRDCPFRSDVTPFLRAGRVKEILDDIILRGDNHFHCHKTIEYGENDNGDETHGKERSQVCAGAMIMQERAGRPSVLARLGRLFGAYDPAKLNMNAPVYETPQAMIAAHTKENCNDA